MPYPHRFLSYDDQLILLALSAGPPPSVVAIYDQIVADTLGDYVEQSSLYRHVHSLIKRGYIDPHYNLTEQGKSQLRNLATDWQRLATLAKDRTQTTLPAYP